jgi:hypothetical protein
MSAIVIVDDQEALPIRAIPYITGWTLSPDIVTKSLAKTDHWVTRLEGLTAYHLLPDGEYAPMLPKEWDGIEAELQVLSDKLKVGESFDQEHYPEWRKRSISVLPAGCFVWKEDFAKAFLRSYSPQKLTLMDERPGDRELNYSPRVPPELRTLVMEGFFADAESEGYEESAEPENLGRRKLQHEVILAVIAALGYEHMAIPDGGKAQIKSILLNRPLLFTESGFSHAWKAGVDDGLFRLLNHDRFSPK